MKANAVRESIWYSCWDLVANSIWESTEDQIYYLSKNLDVLLIDELVKTPVRALNNSIYYPIYDSVESSIIRRFN